MNTAKAKIYYFFRVIGVYRRLKKAVPPAGHGFRLCQKNRGPSRQGPRIYPKLSVNAPHESEITRHQHQLLTCLIIMLIFYPINPLLSIIF